MAVKEMQAIDEELIPLNKKIKKMNSDMTALKSSLNNHVST